MHSKVSYDLQEKQSSFPPNDRWGCHLRAICNTMDTHNIDICPIERYGYALKSVRDISRICEEEMRESNHMRDITHLYPTTHIACVIAQCYSEIMYIADGAVGVTTCCRLWHRGLSSWQPAGPQVDTRSSHWQLLPVLVSIPHEYTSWVFDEYTRIDILTHWPWDQMADIFQ